MIETRRRFLEQLIKGAMALPVLSMAAPTLDAKVIRNPDAMRGDGGDVGPDIYLFELGGRTVFPIYDASGGVSTSFIAYLMATRAGRSYSFPIEMFPRDIGRVSSFGESAEIILKRDIPKFVEEFNRKINNGTAREIHQSGDLVRYWNNDGVRIEI